MVADVPNGPDACQAVIGALPEARALEARELDTLYRQETGFAPHLWNGRIIGYGAYAYTYDSGRSGQFLATGFAMRTAGLSFYIMPGYADHSAILDRLGPHKMGKACLNVTRLDRIDLDALRELIRAGLTDLRNRWPVTPEPA
ncbi:hypothetical protein JANAI62_29590 [Jannaschia pagri]|uniref:YdhG-like domain-containing protein n=1 Tax=Jannaschia pagri TaxID=2829797 RepID=A0ABQ4NPJ4_9RHOB|nr:MULTISPECIES: DUF1801 domain-containing protein [unclassified Jannaschia]GIT92501.1 hypothetical protein JANAI61_29590 [Jannaschia sp. AI_61]GIT96336.1 hypothetical protein JANAI62_29590 [Jannaschia sp. AI_62]